MLREVNNYCIKLSTSISNLREYGMKDVALRVVAEWLDRKAIPAMIVREAGKINLTEATEIIAVVDPGREVAGEQYFR